jgi:CRP-like cAMP-binding protein
MVLLNRISNKGGIMRESRYLKDDVRNIEKLMGFPVLQGFEVSSMGGLLTISKVREYEDGECILEEGKRGRWIYFLYSGEVRIVKAGQTLARLKRSGDMFGEMGMIGGFDRSASAVAVGKTSCLATDASRIDDITGEDKLAFKYILYRIFAEVVTERLKSTTNELIAVKRAYAKLKGRQRKLAA